MNSTIGEIKRAIGVETFRFLVVEDEPLLPLEQGLVVSAVAFGSLVTGCVINWRILAGLRMRKKDGDRTSINKLFIANTVVSLALHPPQLVNVHTRSQLNEIRHSGPL